MEQQNQEDATIPQVLNQNVTMDNLQMFCITYAEITTEMFGTAGFFIFVFVVC